MLRPLAFLLTVGSLAFFATANAWTQATPAPGSETPAAETSTEAEPSTDPPVGAEPAPIGEIEEPADSSETSADPADPAAAETLGLTLEAADGGFAIKSVEQDSTAYARGLREGDVIISADGREFVSEDELLALLRQPATGEQPISIKVRRAGQEQELSWTGTPADPAAKDPGSEFDERAWRERMDRRLADDAFEERREVPIRQRGASRGAIGITLRGKGPVYVAGVHNDSPADNAGLKVGDEIVSVDGRAVTDANGVAALIHRDAAESVTLAIRRDGDVRDVELQLEAWQAAFDGQAVGIGLREGEGFADTGAVEHQTLRPTGEADGDVAALRREVEELRREVTELRSQLRQLQAGAGTAGAGEERGAPNTTEPIHGVGPSSDLSLGADDVNKADVLPDNPTETPLDPDAVDAPPTSTDQP